MLYKIADIVIDIKFAYEYGKKRMNEYAYSGTGEPAFCVAVSEKEVEENILLCKDDFPPSYHEWICVYRKLCLEALKFNCFFMHCSAVCMDGQAYLFTAASGTGKSTHTALWRKHFGERAFMINDDKPLLRFIDGRFYVYGTPWDGKHRLSANTRAPIKGICILTRGESNYIRRATASEMNFMALNQTVRPEQPELMLKTLELADKLLDEVPFYTLSCNMDEEAAQVAYEGMNTDEN